MEKSLYFGGQQTSETNGQVSNSDEGSATYKSEVFFSFTLLPSYLGHNMWNSFNRWAAAESPGEQKLVSSVSSSSCG